MTNLEEYIKNNPIPNFEVESELVKKGLTWLSDNTHLARTVRYATNRRKVINRVENLISFHFDNLQWLHNYLMTANLSKSVFNDFYRLWSVYFKINNPTDVIEEIDLSEKND